jgi:glutaminyl-tRNA synthetase
VRVNAALDFLLQHADEKSVNTAGLETACGVGIVVSPEDIEKEVELVLKTAHAEILEKRYRFPVGMLMGDVRKKLPWADGKAVKSEFDVQVLDMLGPKTEADLAPPAKKEKKAKEAAADKKTPLMKKSEAAEVIEL